MTVTTPNTDAKKIRPGNVLIDVACHSAMSFVTAELVVRPAA